MSQATQDENTVQNKNSLFITCYKFCESWDETYQQFNTSSPYFISLDLLRWYYLALVR